MKVFTAYNTFNLQSALAAASPPTDPPPVPHHPIMCVSDHLWFDEAGRMGCEHAQVPAGDRRTQSCLDHSVAILLLELMVEKESPDCSLKRSNSGPASSDSSSSSSSCC